MTLTFKVKYNSAVRLPTYAFLLMFSNSMLANSAL